MRVAVYGTGGVGGYFGGQLAKAGVDVVFIARGAHLDAIRRSGLTVQSVKGDFAISPAHAESDPASVGFVDVVLVGVKAWQVSEAAAAMRPMIAPDTIVIPLQNGVEAAEQIGKELGVSHAAGGLCRVSCKVAAPGVIQHMGVEPYIAFNWFDNHSDARLIALRDAFLSQGITAEIPANIGAALWIKFAFIAAISGVGAVTHAPAGVQRSIPETRQLLEAAIGEIAAVGRAQGVALPATLEADTMRYIDALPAGTTASMVRDIIAGNPSELDYQNGSVVRLGQACGVPTPVHAFIYASLLPQETRARGKVSF